MHAHVHADLPLAVDADVRADLPLAVHADVRADPPEWKMKLSNPDFIHRAIKQVTDVIVYDIYSPPVASRTYAYVSVAGYEAAVYGNDQFQSLAGQLNGLQPLLRPAELADADPTISAVHAILTVAKTMVISEKQMLDFHQAILIECKNSGVPLSVYDNSVKWGNLVSAHILAWAAKDNYKQTRAMQRFYLSDDEGAWKPTPPAYMKAIEPHWSDMRPFALDSSGQFKPAPATKFSKEKNSIFYKEAYKVFQAGKKLTQEQKNIANFWDCNPYKLNLNGHVMYATKKISPGGHWVNITRLACKKAGADNFASIDAYARLCIGLADAFISCWDEKYRSNVIRPETYINQYIDVAWLPLLQTPPFPEYTSGHSVVSKACAVLLTDRFGENFSYADSTEIEFGLPVRQFRSFREAADEAAISRFYGGIHYMPAISNGLDEGERLGKFINLKLKTRK